MRSATPGGSKVIFEYIVSIHALLAECDDLAIITILQDKRFNPRTPCGVRQAPRKKAPEQIMFQSTHSLRSATDSNNADGPYSFVSIHALLAECDLTANPDIPEFVGFNPRTPCGVRQFANYMGNNRNKFQSTHSLRSATTNRVYSLTKLTFQSTHSLRSATIELDYGQGSDVFQSTHSLRSATQECVESGKAPEVSIHALLAECDCA